MHFFLFVEEPSAEAALENILPRLLGEAHTYQILTHGGKDDLLKKLATKLRSYRAYITTMDCRFIVIIDRDSEDCVALKNRLEVIASEAGIVTKTQATNGVFHLINRIAIEELEAWFLGDFSAINAAYPRVNRNLANQNTYRDPDNIKGGTWEALERVLMRAGYYAGGLPKVEAARTISQYMDIENNRSDSFNQLVAGIRSFLV